MNILKNRPKLRDETGVNYDQEEKQEGFWDDLSLAAFWSKYEIVYSKPIKNKTSKTRIISLQNGKGYIRKRLKMAVLRYYLNYDNDEDLARGLLILFKPFRDEMKEIHQKDVKQLLFDNQDLIEENRKEFEKYKLMTDLIKNIQSEIETNETKNSDDEENSDEDQEVETTSREDLNDFNEWVRNQASKDLAKFKSLVNLCDMKDLRSNIASLNEQQRRLFDDFTERMVSSDVNENPVYLFIAGEAGTGKSYLVKLLIEAVKIIKIKAGSDLQKPPVIVMAPTANAAFIIGGKTIDSVLGFSPVDANCYIRAQAGRMAAMKFQYEDVHAIFCDEISMVGSMKLAKINYRLQDLADGDKKKEFMGVISFVASGSYHFLISTLKIKFISFDYLNF